MDIKLAIAINSDYPVHREDKYWALHYYEPIPYSHGYFHYVHRSEYKHRSSAIRYGRTKCKKMKYWAVLECGEFWFNEKDNTWVNKNTKWSWRVN